MTALDVKDVMTRDPRTVPSTATVFDVYEAMVAGPFHHLPVVEGRLPVGIVSDRDVFQHMPSLSPARIDPQAHGEFMRRRVVDVMTANPFTVPEDESLETAITLMTVNNFNAVLVVDGQQALTGIVTTFDISMTLLKILRGEIAAGK